MSSESQLVTDSSVLLDLFTAADENRVDHAKRIIKAAERESIELMLPAIVVAELAGAPRIRGDDIPRREREEKIAKVRNWLTGARFTLIEIDERIAIRATELCAPYQLKGADAIILAATELWSIPDLYTNDGGLLKVGQQVAGVNVREPSTFPLHEQTELDLD